MNSTSSVGQSSKEKNMEFRNTQGMNNGFKTSNVLSILKAELPLPNNL